MTVRAGDAATRASPGPPTAGAGHGAPAPAIGRHGSLALSFERRGSATVVAACRWTLPLQVLAPLELEAGTAVVSLLNPTGGLVGGDRLTIDACVNPGARACLTTPSATRVYRTAGAVAEQRVRLRVGAEAALEWVPDHAIPFAGSAFRQSIEAEVAEGDVLILVDAFAAGRVARGEAWSFARFESALAVRDARGWLLRDRIALPGGLVAGALGACEGSFYVATVAVIGDVDAAALEGALSGAAAAVPGARAGVARLARRGVLVRALAEGAPALTALVEAVWGAARAGALGRPPLALRKP